MRQKFSLIAVTLALAACSAAGQTTAFYFISSPTSWVGHGETRLVLPSEASFAATRNVYNGVSLSINTGDPHFIWLLDFNAPNRVPLAVGTYLNAIRYPSYPPSLPGLNFSYDGRGDNTLTGYFDILEIQYGSGNSIVSFAADFVQYDEGNMDWWNQGSIRFNSSLPIPEPAVPSLMIVGCAILLRKLCQGKTQ
jgi:hypothetical protein